MERAARLEGELYFDSDLVKAHGFGNWKGHANASIGQSATESWLRGLRIHIK